MAARRRQSSYIVVVGGAHLESPIPGRSGRGDVVANNILEGITASPLTAAASDIPSHGVTRGKVVPRANELDRLDRRIRLTRGQACQLISRLISGAGL